MIYSLAFSGLTYIINFSVDNYYDVFRYMTIVSFVTCLAVLLKLNT